MTNLDDAQLAAELGADAIGFVFAESKRRVTPEQVAAITPLLPSSVEKVGVFCRPDAAWIVDVAKTARLTAVQLHFDFDGELLEKLQELFEAQVKLIQVVSVPVDADEAELGRVRQLLLELLRRPELYAVLLDAAQGSRSGGMGKAFAWEPMSRVLAEVREETGAGNGFIPYLLLAGGLHAENVEAAVTAIKPFGVDVVSGVEAAPGTKSPERLSHFLQITRNL